MGVGAFGAWGSFEELMVTRKDSYKQNDFNTDIIDRDKKRLTKGFDDWGWRGRRADRNTTILLVVINIGKKKCKNKGKKRKTMSKKSIAVKNKQTKIVLHSQGFTHILIFLLFGSAYA